MVEEKQLEFNIPERYRKFKFSLTIDVETGNAPYKAVLYTLYIPKYAVGIYDAAGIKGVLTRNLPHQDGIGIYLTPLMEALLHICDNPEIYIDNAFVKDKATVADYHTAIHLLADIITHINLFPRSNVRFTEEV